MFFKEKQIYILLPQPTKLCSPLPGSVSEPSFQVMESIRMPVVVFEKVLTLIGYQDIFLRGRHMDLEIKS